MMFLRWFARRSRGTMNNQYNNGKITKSYANIILRYLYDALKRSLSQSEKDALKLAIELTEGEEDEDQKI